MPELGLLPADDEDLTSSAVLDAAELSALEDPFGGIAAEPPVPYGRSWEFDYGRRRFVRDGGSPREVRGGDALAVWLLNGLHTRAGAHPILPRTVGMGTVDDWIGEVNPAEQLADFEDDFRAMALQHPRVADVEEIEFSVDRRAGVISIDALTVVTDQDESVPLFDMVVSTGVIE